MTDFFSRLAERALNIAPTIQPMIVPLYASEAQHIEDGLLDSVEEQEGQNPLSTTMPTPKTQHVQASALLPEPQRTQVTIPEIQLYSFTSAPESAVQPIQAAKTPALVDAPHILETETHTMPQPYPVPQRIVQQPASNIEQQVTSETITKTQIMYTSNNKVNTASHTTDQNPLSHMADGGDSHEQADSHSQNSEQRLATTKPLTQEDRSSGNLEHGHMSNLNSTPAAVKRDTPTSVMHITHSAETVVSNGATSPLQAINGYYRPYERQHSWTAKEAPVAPTIQVTIGRIEVRATTAPALNAPVQRQQVAPPVMSLDDYLNQRAKGGR